MDYSYITNDNSSVMIGNDLIVNNEDVLNSINFCNTALQTLNDQTQQFDINIFEVLGLRNLSGLVGEYFGKSVQYYSHGRLQSNLHQDGYPDLILTNTTQRLAYYKSLYTEHEGKKYPKDKSSFSPYKYGGVEVKATCGSTPPATKVAKPLIGEKRINKLVSFDWKAHHRTTNDLLAILWDFVNNVPTIVGCFYRNDLSQDDWGKIVTPKSNGGRTTSVSIMKQAGVKKMCQGWLAVIDESEYIEFLSGKKWIGDQIKTI